MGDQERLEVTEGQVSDRLRLSAYPAVAEVLLDVLTYLWPIELLTDELKGFGSSWVPWSWNVMGKFEDFQLQGGMVRYVECVAES